MIDLKDFDAIIFDLGGVVLNIDYQKTIEAFQNLGIRGFDRMYGKMQQSGTFDLLETGKINAADFKNEMRKKAAQASDDEILACWNAMLLDFPGPRIEMLQTVRKEKSTFLLSNTNEIHLKAFTEILRKQTGLTSLNDLFDKVYLSHEIGMRKPHPETFEFVISDAGLNATRTLFIDDSPQHVDGARKAGLQAYHLKAGESIENLLHNLYNLRRPDKVQ